MIDEEKKTTMPNMRSTVADFSSLENVPLNTVYNFMIKKRLVKDRAQAQKMMIN